MKRKEIDGSTLDFIEDKIKQLNLAMTIHCFLSKSILHIKVWLLRKTFTSSDHCFESMIILYCTRQKKYVYHFDEFNVWKPHYLWLSIVSNKYIKNWDSFYVWSLYRIWIFNYVHSLYDNTSFSRLRIKNGKHNGYLQKFYPFD